MMIPIRCITCGAPISGKWETFKEKVANGEKPGAVLDELGLTRYCCRTLFLTNKDVIKDVSIFKV